MRTALVGNLKVKCKTHFSNSVFEGRHEAFRIVSQELRKYDIQTMDPNPKIIELRVSKVQ